MNQLFRRFFRNNKKKRIQNYTKSPIPHSDTIATKLTKNPILMQQAQPKPPRRLHHSTSISITSDLRTEGEKKRHTQHASRRVAGHPILISSPSSFKSQFFPDRLHSLVAQVYHAYTYPPRRLRACTFSSFHPPPSLHLAQSALSLARSTPTTARGPLSLYPHPQPVKTKASRYALC